jgi:hypothetical protein
MLEKDKDKDKEKDKQTDDDIKQPMGSGSKSVQELLKKMVGGEKAVEKMCESKAGEQVEKIKLIGSHYRTRGRCKRCGWQTFQFDDGQVEPLVKTHALVHWPDMMAEEVAAELAGTESQPTSQSHDAGVR